MYVVNSAFKCRIITYRINGSSTVLSPKVYLTGASSQVQKVIRMELESNKHVKVNLELFCMYIIAKGDDED